MLFYIKVWTVWVTPNSLFNNQADPNYRRTGPWYR